MSDAVAILDYGSQFTQLIARRLREAQVYCEVLPYSVTKERLAALNPKGVVLSGSSWSCTEQGAPQLNQAAMDLGVPVLGLCYGMQILAQTLGGKVESCKEKEFGFASLDVGTSSTLFEDISPDTVLADGTREWHVWMSHGDQVTQAPADFTVVARSSACPIAAFENSERQIFGCQFHPEVNETKMGTALLKRFAVGICGVRPSWTSQRIVERILTKIREQIGGEEDGDPHDVILGLSGGVDSSVVAALLHRVVGRRLRCVLVDTGMMRLNEAAEIRRLFSLHFPDLHLEVLDESKRFLEGLKGVTDPEQKRSIIGRLFVESFEQSAKKYAPKYLAQGTIYPDVIESAESGHATLIKSHHNVGGLPERMKLKLVEPIRTLFKDEVRRIGEELGLPHEFLYRHPFPGPGLAVRILGEITPDRIQKVQHADDIFIRMLREHGLYHQVAQAFAALFPVRAVSVQGDGRAYEEVISLRAVVTEDFMTATIGKLPHEFLVQAGRNITNTVAGVSRVVYDLTEKPQGTVEYE